MGRPSSQQVSELPIKLITCPSKYTGGERGANASQNDVANFLLERRVRVLADYFPQLKAYGTRVSARNQGLIIHSVNAVKGH